MATSADGYRVLAPGDPVADVWMTRPGCERVLAIAPHLQAATRLACDVLPHLETDRRLQVVWSIPDTGYRWSGIGKFVDGLDGLRVKWPQARGIRYDLVVAACRWGLEETTGPKLLMPHGINGARSRIGPDLGPVQHDLHRGVLMHNNKVVPSALVLPHASELTLLRAMCPEALPYAVVGGDPCFDRMLASRHLRPEYRRALGVQPGQKLVVVTTTWSEHSLFGTAPSIFERLAAELPTEEYRIVAILHPFVWYAHSRRTVLAWLATARAAGLAVLPPEEGWRAALVAADLLVGDHGSVAQYGAALGVPLLMNRPSLADVRSGSTADELSRHSTLLDPTAPLLPQVQRAAAAPPFEGFAEMTTSQHGRSMSIVRQTCYDLLGITEPDEPVQVLPLSLPITL